jgi:hypothetical protein
VINDAFYFVFLFSFQEVRWGPRIIWSMLHAFVIGG